MLTTLVRSATATLLTASLARFACDTGVPASEGDLLGTWALVSVYGQSVLTVSESQTVVDLSRPASGALQVSGSVGGELRFVEGYDRSGTMQELRLTSYDPRTDAPPPSRLLLSIRERAESSELSLEWATETEFREFALPLSRPVREGATVELDAELYPAEGGEPAVRVWGTFTLGERRLIANEATPIQTEMAVPGSEYTLRYRFGRNGVLGDQTIQGDDTTERLGRWARTGDRLTLTVLEGLGVSTERYRVEQEGNSLRLVATQDTYVCDSQCRSSAEREFGLAPGTLRSVEPEGVYQFEPFSDDEANGEVRTLPSPRTGALL